MKTKRRSVLRSLRCAIEALESRRLMHGGFSDVHINFQPAGTVVPTDYLPDNGLVYAARGNGLTYGWSTDNKSGMRDRNSKISPDQRQDTFALLDKQTWEIALPNGTYNIRIVAGDAAYPALSYRIDAEGQRIVDGDTNASDPWIEGSMNVTVADDKLTVASGAGAGLNRICFIEINHTHADGPSPLAEVNVVAAEPSAAETNKTPGKFTFTRTGSTANPLVVRYAMSGNAGNGTDYDSLTGFITIPAGQITSTLTLTPVDDSLVESNETASLTIIADAAYIMGGTASANVTIADNDVSVGTNLGAKINFQPDGKPIPSGYVADTGLVFGSRNGLTYGWSGDNRSWARDRDSSKSLDQRYDTLNVFNSLSWDLAVPNGTYDVRIVAGDAAYPVGNYKINVEGVLAINGAGTTAAPWLDGTVRVTVTDGKLTLTNAANVGGTNKICFIEVMPPGALRPPTPPSPTSNKITWSTKAASPIPRGEAQSAVVGSKLYLFGGYADFTASPSARSDVYDTVTNTWTRIADMPVPATHAGTAVIGRDIYIAGGYIGPGSAGNQTFASKQVYKYNVDSNSWTAIAPLPEARGGGALVTVGNTLHFFGGSDLARKDRGEHWSLTIGSNAWASKSPMLTKRNHLGGVVLNGKIYAVGGQQNQDAAEVAQAALEVYDPATNMWSSLAAMPFGRSHIAGATVIANGRIVTLGGETLYQTHVSNVTAYDPATNTWSELTSLPAKRSSGVGAFIDGAFYHTTGIVTSVTWKGVVS